MNVKILSIFITINMIFFSVFSLFYFTSKNNINIDCVGNVNINIFFKSTPLRNLKGNIRISAHLTQDKNKRSYTSEYGYIYEGDEKYIVDRNVRLLFKHVNTNGFSEVEIEGIDKGLTDTLPLRIEKELMSNQNVYFYKFDEVYNGILRWQDLKRTILICKLIK